MLNYEEKKALENMKIFARVHPDMTIVTAKEMDTVVTLVEKQQKEIETLKEKIKNFTIEDEKIFIQFGEITEKIRWKYKIKAKIEYLLKRYDSEEDFCSYDVLISILKSFLVKEFSTTITKEELEKIWKEKNK